MAVVTPLAVMLNWTNNDVIVLLVYDKYMAYKVKLTCHCHIGTQSEKVSRKIEFIGEAFEKIASRHWKGHP